MEIIISPERKLYINPDVTGETAQEFVREFNNDSVSGLLALARSSVFRQRSVSTMYWYEFCSQVLKNFITIKLNSHQTVAPDREAVLKYLEFMPELKGREYLDQDYLYALWERLNSTIQQEFANFGSDFEKFLGARYPDWNQVGRIHFHLAESRKDIETPFAFLATYTTRVSARVRVQHIPLGQVLAEFAGKADKELLLSVIQPIKTLAASSEFMAGLVASKKIYRPCYFTTSQAFTFLKSIKACEEAGIVVKLPEGWQQSPPPRAMVTVNVGQSHKKQGGSHSLFQFTVNVSVCGENLLPEELSQLLNSEEKLSQIKGKWVEVDCGKIKELLEKWHKANFLREEGFTLAQAMRLVSGTAITGSDHDIQNSPKRNESFLEFKGVGEFKKVLKGMCDPTKIDLDETAGILERKLHAKLRPYQQVGVKWLRFLSRLGLGGCLCDDMGLGKTIQIISLLLIEQELEKTRPPNLLIVPASLLGNWESEIKKFAPSIKVQILHRSFVSKQQIAAFKSKTHLVDLVITTYDLVKTISWLKEASWNILIADEVQAIKNPAAQKTRALKQVPARIKIAMTGTPIENSLIDLWSIFDFCCQSLLGSQTEFKTYQKSIRESTSYEPLRRLIQPYILRRQKTDRTIISDLPMKTELKSYCLLTKEQIKLYQKNLDELALELKEKSSSEIKRKSSILKYLLRFKQICNHPSQFYSDNIYDYKKSGKFFRLKEIAETISAKGEKVLIFTQFREITDILCSYLGDIFGRPGYVLHGSTPIKKRKKMVDDFQKDYSAPYFVLSIKAGGTGLNLTKASHVIHFDRWWNPAVENQATDRAFRIGQKKNVIVHKFICKGTIEEKIDLMIEDKKNLSHDILGKDQEKKITEMSDDDILKLVALDIKSAEI